MRVLTWIMNKEIIKEALIHLRSAYVFMQESIASTEHERELARVKLFQIDEELHRIERQADYFNVKKDE